MSEAAFELAGVTKAFGSQVVLDGVDLKVAQGSVCAVLGRSGSGKTVLLKLLTRLLRPDSGVVYVEGHDLSQLTEQELFALREHTGVLFQGDALFDSLEVFDNVAFPLREVGHLGRDELGPRVTRALQRVGLSRIEHELPGALSGGMRKRVAFARATVLEPRLLLLDDPTAGLDPLSTRQVAAVIREATRNLKASAVIVTHDIATAVGVADHLALLDEGRIIVEGPPQRLVSSTDPKVARFFHAYRDRLEESAATR